MSSLSDDAATAARMISITLKQSNTKGADSIPEGSILRVLFIKLDID